MAERGDGHHGDQGKETTARKIQTFLTLNPHNLSSFASILPKTLEQNRFGKDLEGGEGGKGTQEVHKCITMLVELRGGETLHNSISPETTCLEMATDTDLWR